MRSLTLPDGSNWQLETVDEPRPSGAAPHDPGRRRTVAERTWAWVRCVGPTTEFRLMFAAAWEVWSDATLVRAIDAELERTRSVPRAD